MQYIDRCIDDFARLPRSTFLAEYAVPVLVFAPRERSETAGGFDFGATQLLRLVTGVEEPAVPEMPALVAPLKKRAGIPGRQISLGRTQATDICLDSPDVSTLHAYFNYTQGQGYSVTDSGSKNGTRMGEVKLTANVAYPVGNATRIAFAGHEAVLYSSEGFYLFVQQCAAEVRRSRLGS